MASRITPATFLMPSSSAEPLEVRLKDPALRMAVVRREVVAALDPSWEARGVYVLLGPDGDPGSYTAYVGKVDSPRLRSRLAHHARTRPGWERALLVRRDTSDGFNSAETGWLEGRLSEVLERANRAKLTMGRRDHDESLPEYERDVLELMIRPITAVMRVIDASPDTPDQQVQPPATTPSKRKPGAVKDLLDAGLLKAGAKLRPVSAGHEARSTVAADGRLEFGGKTFNTPSGAAAAAVGGSANGWTFWAVPSGDGSLVPLDELRRRLGLGKPDERPDERPEADPAPPAQGTSLSPPSVPKRPRSGGLTELVEAGVLAVGARLVATYKGAAHEASVAEDGRLRFPDGSVEPSLSMAATRVTERPTNGWTFWRLDHAGQATSLAALRDELRGRS
jgi:hypothetical protein